MALIPEYVFVGLQLEREGEKTPHIFTCRCIRLRNRTGWNFSVKTLSDGKVGLWLDAFLPEKNVICRESFSFFLYKITPRQNNSEKENILMWMLSQWMRVTSPNYVPTVQSFSPKSPCFSLQSTKRNRGITCPVTDVYNEKNLTLKVLVSVPLAINRV